MLESLALALGVAMDASAVAAARGLQPAARAREGVVLALWFGVFQAAMAALGFGLAHVGDDWFAAIDHWIASGTLVAIGGKMLRDAWRERAASRTIAAKDPVIAPLERAIRGASSAPWRSFLALAIATSIDAAAVGMSLPLMNVEASLAIGLIGVVTFGCAALAHAIARTLGRWLGGGMEALGGGVLIALGVRILVQHL